MMGVRQPPVRHDVTPRTVGLLLLAPRGAFVVVGVDACCGCAGIPRGLILSSTRLIMGSSFVTRKMGMGGASMYDVRALAPRVVVDG